MIDINIKGPLPPVTNKLCWWDRNSFKTVPLGCPLKYHAKILENKKMKKDTEIFETEGIFCGFACCRAYILSQKNNLKYKDSLGLLSMIALAVCKKQIDIPTAPTFKILKEYGGHLTIAEYRKLLGVIDFEENINYQRSAFITRSQYTLEKKRKFR
jgi:hypothetical protein